MYCQLETPDHLKHLVCFFYSMEHKKEDGDIQKLLPSSTPVMGWQFEGKWRLDYTLNNTRHQYLLPEFYIVGQLTIGYNLSVEKEKAGILGAALQPDALWQILGSGVERFSNAPRASEEAFTPYRFPRYKAAYQKAGTSEERLKIMIDFFTELDKQITHRYNPMEDVLKLIFREKGALKVLNICEELHMPERYLQRTFKKIIGISPKDFIRSVRFNNMFTQLSLDKTSQNQELLAMLYNYYDLSHFHKDYKHFFDVSPARDTLSCFHLFRELVETSPYLLQVQKKHMGELS